MTKYLLTLFFLMSLSITAASEDKLLLGDKVKREIKSEDNKVVHQCLQPDIKPFSKLELKRDKPWSLPDKALGVESLDTIKVLALRYNFQYETIDDPNTTGRGEFDLSSDSALFYDSAGHYVDPPPHNADYFRAHLRALREYIEIISDDRVSLSYEVYPQTNDSAYRLPQLMNYYGKCDLDSVVLGLENYFVDCITTADNVSPDINFSDYDAFILFHAGSDQQNNIGFPETCADMFTGFINFGDSVAVDGGTVYIRSALLMPETASQDNRATALNAVLAHEFGHQLGLPDLYSTSTFMSQLGDFALMDNNGFATGIDFDFDVGRVFGVIPLFPTAWCRAYLGYVEVVDFRQGTDIKIVAAEIVSDGIKVARIPISENEYYLLENRLIDFDGFETGAQQDSLTSVFLGPAYNNPATGFIERSREYDFLLPGSGVIIYHVDEKVAALDYDFDGVNNFEDNDLQWVWDINGTPVNRFITIVEGDGFVNFGGYYRSGYGRAEDMYRDDRNTSLTPNSNPQSVDNTGNNTRIRITDITRDEDISSGIPVLMDTVITFDVEIDKLVAGFPVRMGAPRFPISPIVDDIDGDGNDEIIIVSDDKLGVITTDGKNFLREFTNCTGCPTFIDTAIASVHPGKEHFIPVYGNFYGTEIYTVPVTGYFPDNPYSSKIIAVGSPLGAGDGWVTLHQLADNNGDGLADFFGRSFPTSGNPIALSFGEALYTLTDKGNVYYKDSFNVAPSLIAVITGPEYHGLARLNNSLIIMDGDEFTSRLIYQNPGEQSILFLDDNYTLGPILVDLDRDGFDEVITASIDGRIYIVSVDESQTSKFINGSSKETGYNFNVNPIAGDIDGDGYAEIIISGTNAVYAFDRNLTLKSSYPVEINDAFPTDRAAASPIIADIELGGNPEIIIPTLNGNLNVLSDKYLSGFPLSAGELGIGSPIFVNDTTGGKLGYLGLDGWFYLWYVDSDVQKNFWTMSGGDPSGSNRFDDTKLESIAISEVNFDPDDFYNYPNPVIDGMTTIRYFLGGEASSVELALYDFSGKEIVRLDGPTLGNAENELEFDCSGLTPGVYRCIINIDFDGNKESAFTDIAVIR